METEKKYKELLHTFIDEARPEILQLLADMIFTMILNGNASRYDAIASLIATEVGEDVNDWLKYVETIDKKTLTADIQKL